MATWIWIVIAISVVIVLALVALGGRRRQQEQLEERRGQAHELWPPAITESKTKGKKS